MKIENGFSVIGLMMVTRGSLVTNDGLPSHHFTNDKETSQLQTSTGKGACLFQCDLSPGAVSEGRNEISQSSVCFSPGSRGQQVLMLGNLGEKFTSDSAIVEHRFCQGCRRTTSKKEDKRHKRQSAYHKMQGIVVASQEMSDKRDTQHQI